MVWLSKILSMAFWNLSKEKEITTLFNWKNILAFRYHQYCLKITGDRKNKIAFIKWRLNKLNLILSKTFSWHWWNRKVIFLEEIKWQCKEGIIIKWSI